MSCEGQPFWAKKKKDQWEQLKFNSQFLKESLEKNWELHCEYCGKDDLIIYGWCEKVNFNDVATVDHFYPKSKYKNLKKDKSNLIVSCYGCNNEKKYTVWDISKIKYPFDGNKIDKIKKIV